jgi:hypothetical protein
MTTDQELLDRMALVEGRCTDLENDVVALEERVDDLEAGGGGSNDLGDIYDEPTGSTVVNAYALQRICVDGKVLGEACISHPDQLVRTAAGEMLSMLESCGYPHVNLNTQAEVESALDVGEMRRDPTTGLFQ